MKIFLGMRDEVDSVDVDALTEGQASAVVLAVRKFLLTHLDKFPISLLSLSIRAENGLIRQKISTLGDLLRRMDSPRPWPGVGKTSIAEYRRELGRLTQ